MQKTQLRIGSLVLLALLALGGIAFAASDTVRFVVASAAGAIIYGFPSERDWVEADMIREKIISVHHFAHNSLSQPQKPPVFSNPSSQMLLTLPAAIEVYDVGDRAEQDKIANALREFIAERKLKPFKLCFYDHENWVVDGNVGTRGSETQLRCLRITADRLHDIAGEKVITYPTP